MRSLLTCSILPSQRPPQALLPFIHRFFLYSSCLTGRLSRPGWKTVLSSTLSALFLQCDMFRKSSKLVSIFTSLSSRLGIGLRFLWPFGRKIPGCSRSELSTKSSNVSLYFFETAKISDFCLAPATACSMTFFPEQYNNTILAF